MKRVKEYTSIGISFGLILIILGALVSIVGYVSSVVYNDDSLAYQSLCLMLMLVSIGVIIFLISFIKLIWGVEQ